MSHDLSTFTFKDNCMDKDNLIPPEIFTNLDKAKEDKDAAKPKEIKYWDNDNITAVNHVGAKNTHELKKRFLEEYVGLANVTRTCEKVGMVRRTFYYWMRDDPDFKEAFEYVDKLAIGVLEDEATRRAVEGTKKPIFQQGKEVGTITEYSDTLMVVLLKARNPQKYKDRTATEVSGADGKPLLDNLKINHVHSTIPLAMSEDEIVNQLENERKDTGGL